MENSTFIMKLNDLLSPVAAKIGNQRHLKAISSGMMFGLPFIVIGSFFLIFANPPINIDRYNPETANFFMKFMAGWKDFAVANYDLITAPYNLTMGIIGLISVFGIAFSLASEYKINPSMNGMVASVIFLMVCTPVMEGTINLNYLGTNGLFVAILIGLLVVEVNRVFEVRNIKLKLPDTVPPMVATFINTLVPLLTNIILFYGINLIFLLTTKKIFPETVMQILTPATNIAGSLGGFLLIVTLGNILWLFGINGSSIIFPIVFTLGMAQTGLNAEQMANGETMTHLMNLQMFRISVLGGAGGTLGLVLLMIRSKVSEYRTIGKLSLIPGICSINEPVIFGLPIVFNPILAIPFLITPIISLLLTYFAQSVGLISVGFIVDPSFTPFFAQAYLSSMDWRNIVFCFVLILISVVIYYPFFKVMENNKTKLVEEEQ
ncbi:PTS sugar transporter subunit IIC [Enterococcus raffinosus]|uniref:Permease IIC component n=1 Tax=Enterococcus raffinosus TaxID=71452 RepID=A0AAW8STZ9_9ENTE|nr:PTS transporter subunit EIIC [Enterococcus raffinosus]MBS6430377.1 PTS sugar transporter subunit IIC [Enterococcus raffinosus]MDK7989118.1 PTS transporter subunit EIIC [Enterococcus raffinosus]MDT2536768.1 PTS transporter subunit EIIC [Enterococcus raffinosus]MDT2570561.1 PTS transporter subunit EIIC [Enterococcus raffinosus]QXJ60781.1 PTS sugar transporter subunit IIC [Enterococcus raffinosus]